VRSTCRSAFPSRRASDAEGVKSRPDQTEILIKGIDKQQVGQVAAEVRAYRRRNLAKRRALRGRSRDPEETKKK
jgi:large subunit ribosomal protein L6